MKLVNQELKVLQRDAQQTKTQALDDQHNHPSAKWTDKKYSKDRKAESECERIKEWEGGGGELSLAPWHTDKWQQRHYNIER